MRAGLFASALMLGLSVSAQLHAAAGRTEGVFDVSAEGAATYTIPIWVPPGPRGVQPSLALTYSSLGRNGSLGVGWSLAGVSSIERCTQVYGIDSGTSPVTMTNSDRYCLGTNRLRLLSGSYGAANSTYAKEVDDFSVLTASASSQGSGPQSFTLLAKDGTTYEYGTIPTARVTFSSNGTVLRWMLNKVRDRDGNSYTIDYQQSDGAAEPTTFSWSPTTANGSTYRYTAVLSYVDKPNNKDWSTWYVAGNKGIRKKRLSSISIRSQGSQVRAYVLGYDSGPLTGFSRLTSIKECTNDAASTCLQPTTISYQAGRGLDATARYVSVGAGATIIGSADFDGDRKQDLIVTVGSSWYVLFGDNGGFSSPVPVTGLTGSFGSTVDYDNFLPGDRAAFIANVGGVLYTYSASGRSFPGGVSTGISHPTGSVPTGVGGALYWFAPETSTGTNRLNIRNNITPVGNANPVFSSTISGQGNSIGPNVYINGETYHVRLGATQLISNRGLERRDLDGDGYEDLYAAIGVDYCSSPNYCYPFNTYTALLRYGGLDVDDPSKWTVYSGYSIPAAIYFNDDYCSDAAGVAVSPCSKAANAPITQSHTGFWMDWDGDGRTDLAWNNGGTIAIDASTGDGFATWVSNTSIPYNDSYRILDLDGDGMDDIAIVDGSSIRYYTHSASTTTYLTQAPDLVSSVTDGLGNTYSVDYVSTAHSNLQIGSAIATTAKARTVVAVAHSPDGIGSSYTKTYTYVGPREDKTRGTFLGFEERDVRDSRKNLLTKTYYRQAFPRTGWVWKTEVYRDETTLLSKTESADDVYPLSSTTFAERYFPYVTSTTSEVYEPQGTATLIQRKTVDFSNYDFTTGNIGTITTTLADNNTNEKWTSAVTMEYAPKASGCFDLPSRIKEELDRVLPDQPVVTRTVSFTKDGSYCRQKTQTIEPDSNQYRVTTTYGYDSFGNVNSVAIDALEPSASNPSTYQPMATRTSSVYWGSAGVAPETITNALNQSTTITYYPETGLPHTITDPNALTTTLGYDGFGRLTSRIARDQTSETIEYRNCASDVGCLDSNHVLTVLKSEQDGSWQRIYFDKFERPLVTRSSQLNGYAQWNQVGYDNLGRLTQSSIPCLTTSPTSSCVTAWNSLEYDLLGRMTKSSRPANENELTRPITTTVTYAGLTSTITDPLNRTSSQQVNITGQLIKSTDANGYYQDFSYDSAGSLIQVREKDQTGRSPGPDPDPVLFSASYVYGAGAFQISSHDRALGTRTRWYDGLGELRRWRDAKNQDFFADYDSLSRLVSRSEPDTQTNYVWGNNASAHDIGQLASMSSTSGGETYAETFLYDGYARLHRQSITLPGDATTYAYDFDYDPTLGVLSTITYPSSTSLYRLSVKYNTTSGILTSITDATDGTAYWQLDQSVGGMNAFGQITNDKLGAGIVRARSFDAVTGALEKITAGPAANPIALQNASISYDDLGNATQRQNNLGSLPASLTETFHYGGGTNSDQLDRLTSVDLTDGSTPSTPLSQTFYETGDLKHREDLGGTSIPVDMTIGWTSYNYPKSITAPWLNESATFSYGPNRDRWRMVYSQGGNGETTYYLGGLMEKVVNGSSIEFRHYVAGPEDIIALYTRASNGTNTLSYLLGDQQGSIDTIASSAGAALVNESFSAYGLRRDPSDWSGVPTNSGDSLTRQGYTFQTVLGKMGLNHMNGRVQDTVSGTFLSPDPFVSEPGNTQSWNRYAYTYHNPMSYVDPSGFIPWANNDGPTDNPNGPDWDVCSLIPGICDGGHHPALPSCAYLGECVSTPRNLGPYVAPQTYDTGKDWRGVAVVAEGPEQSFAWKLFALNFFKCMANDGLAQFRCTPEQWRSAAKDYALVYALPGGMRGLGGTMAEVLQAGQVAAASRSAVWALGAFQRGRVIEQALGSNLPSNFPVIDKFVRGIATSIKSLDTAAASYQDAAALTRTLNGYVDDLAAFAGRTWAGVSIPGSSIVGKELILAIPSSVMTAAQQAAIQAAVQRAASMGVNLVIKVL